MDSATPGLVVLQAIRKKVKQAMGSKSVSSVPPRLVGFFPG